MDEFVDNLVPTYIEKDEGTVIKIDRWIRFLGITAISDFIF